jgi:predicted enzyme related to lactoylglutathione lyase
MVSDGNATVFVSDMDRSIRFYTEILGMKLTNRFGNDWATVRAGEGLTIGLHPASEKYPAPGTKGAVVLGLEIETTIERAVARLANFGVGLKGSVTRGEAGNFATIADPDGNEIYLWEKTLAEVETEELAVAEAR